MTRTPELIDRLVADAEPVSRLWRPGWRAVGWMALVVTVVLVLVPWYGLRPDLAERLADPFFVAGQGGAILTGALAALAACMLSLPDRGSVWLLLPWPAAAIWIGGVSVGCLTDWVRFEPEGFAWGEAASCFVSLLLVAVPLSIAMFWGVRHAARLRPRPVVLTGALSVAALSAAAMALLHPFEASAMILLWNFGTAGLVLAADGALGRRILAGRL